MKNKKIYSKWFLLITIVISVFLTGCGLQQEEAPQPNMTEIISAAQTQASGTLQAEQAEAQANAPLPTATVEVVPTFTPLPTLDIHIEPTATFPPLPTQGLPPTAVPQQPVTTDGSGRPCWRALLLSETIPDGTEFVKGGDETKSWTLLNTGSCTWTQDTKLVLIDGANLFGGFAFDIGNIPPFGVGPNEYVRVEIKFLAPTSAGTFRSVFLLRSYTGETFGIGDLANEVFWMEIVVK